jgi:hypothetical protein
LPFKFAYFREIMDDGHDMSKQSRVNVTGE